MLVRSLKLKVQLISPPVESRTLSSTLIEGIAAEKTVYADNDCTIWTIQVLSKKNDPESLIISRTCRAVVKIVTEPNGQCPYIITTLTASGWRIHQPIRGHGNQ
jgi:hypothetical protein